MKTMTQQQLTDLLRTYVSKSDETERAKLRDLSDTLFVNITFEAYRMLGFNFAQCIFDKCLFSDADLERCELMGAHFTNCTIEGTDITRANLRHARFEDCTITETLFTHSELTSAEFRFTKIARSNFRRAQATNAEFYDVQFSGGNLDAGNFEGSVFERCKLWDVDMDSTVLKDVRFAECDFSGADMRGANFHGAMLSQNELILAGYDIRGYLFYAYLDTRINCAVVRAGCRRFTIAEAKKHWKCRHVHNPIQHTDCLSLVERLDKMIKVRGWPTKVAGAVLREKLGRSEL
jgi:uncharacterized protein YjbI with pentapeptide repeats